jgi:Right handed beta helix region
MSYTLRGRLESRLAALALPLAAACVAAAALAQWWPVGLAAAMLAVAIGVDLVYHPLLRYQPGWAALPLGLLELGVVMAVVIGFHVRAPVAVALGLFAAAWVCAQLLGHALLPLWRLSYAEDGGELGVAGGALVVAAVAAPLAAAGGLWYAHLPPVVHLASGVHRGPLVITRREKLVGAPGAIVRGGIVVAHKNVEISHVTVVGGVNGITVDGMRGVKLSHVTVVRPQLDGIHVRGAAIMIDHCNIDMRGVPYGQGIDISYNMDMGETMVSRCTVVGGQEGIVTHSSSAMLEHNRVESTTMRAISMTEMSMGGVMHNTVSNANGIGILCGDHSMCMIDRNDVSGTKVDRVGGDRERAGYGLVVEFGADADVGRNDLTDNPLTMGVFVGSLVHWQR